MEDSTADELPPAARPLPQEPLSPLLASALNGPVGTLRERLRRIAKHSPAPERYRELGEIARGGMGRVMRVWDEELQRELAMKTVAIEPAPGAPEEERLDHERRLVRFIDEARVTGQLGHPGIVPVHEIAIHPSGSLFFTMPLVRGATLAEVISRVHGSDTEWNLARGVRVLHTVCQTVAFAHARGVIHRDLKPDNVMVGPFGEAYVVDWGLALVLGREEPSTVVGTPAYMAPEQATGNEVRVSPLADVYSLGAILYQLLSGRMPHALSLEADPDPGRFGDLAARPPRPLREVDGDLDPELVAICDKAMAARPEDRYASVEDLARDLEAWMEGRVVSVHDTRRVTRLRKWRTRNRALALALDVMLVVILASAAGLVFQQRLMLREVRAERSFARARSYTANLAAAELGLRAHETAGAKRNLENCRPELRGWEWRHLALRADEARAVLLGHRNGVGVVAFGPSGDLAATGGDDGTVRLWDADGQGLRVIRAHEKPVTDLAFDPGGGRVATAARDDQVKIWDLASGELEEVLEGMDEVVALAYRGPGALACLEWDGTLTLFGGAPAERGSIAVADKPVTDLAVDAATGTLWVSCASGYLRGFDPVLGEAIVERSLAEERITCLEVCAGSELLAAAVGSDVLLFDPRSSVEPQRWEVGGSVGGLARSRDGSWLATVGYDNVVRLWESETGRLALELDGHERGIRSVAFHPDGEHLLTGAEDDTARLWDVRGGASLVLEGHGTWVTALGFDAEGRTLVSGEREGTVLSWDLERGEVRLRAEVGGVVDDLAAGSAGAVVVAAGAGGLRSGRMPALDVLAASAVEPRRVTLAGEHVLYRDRKGDVVGLDASGTERFRTAVETDLEWSLAVSSDGRRFAAGRADGAVVLGSAETGQVLRVFGREGDAVTYLAFDPDGARLAAATEGTRLLLIDLETGDISVLEGHGNRTCCVAFSPDGERLVSGSFDRTVRLWDPVTGEPLLSLRGHRGAVTDVAFSPDGRQVASASKDGTVRLWRTRASGR